MTLLWKFTVLDEYGFMVIFMSEAFSTINAACNDWCPDQEDFSSRKKKEDLSLGELLSTYFDFLTQCLFFLLSHQNLLYRLMSILRWIHIIHD